MFQDFSRVCRNQPAPELEKGVGGRKLAQFPPATLGSPVIAEQDGLGSARLYLWTWPQKAKLNNLQTPQRSKIGNQWPQTHSPTNPRETAQRAREG